MNDYVILDLHWNRQTVRDSKGNVSELLRGKDYDLDWVLMGECFAKFENVILKYDNLCFEKLKKTIDFDTFDLVVSNENGTHYFKDKSKVYLKYYNKEYVLEGAEPDKFTVLDIEKGLSTDTLRYYYYEKIIPFNLSKATILNDFYTIADSKVFFCFEEIEGADAESFVVVRENLGKDKSHVYFKGKIVLGADSETFRLFEDNEFYEQMDYVFYARDKIMAYFIDTTAKAVKSIKSKSLNEFRFEIIDKKGFCFDKEYRYYFGKRTNIGK
jgi:ribosomal protein S24E